jgi:hypothetical protein
MTRLRKAMHLALAAGTLALAAGHAAAAEQQTGTTDMPDPHRWSAEVTKHSNALDLEPGVFESKDPKHIALSLKKSAEESHRRRSDPYRSAMSMLTFYINRAGSNLPVDQKAVLEKAKDELRKAFGREPADD